MSDPASGGNVAADIAEDIKEAGEGVITFLQAEIQLVEKGIAAEKTLIVASVSNATSWLVAKATQITGDAQAGLSKIIDDEKGNNPADLVANVLSAIYNDAKMVALGIAPEIAAEIKAIDLAVLAGITAVTTLSATL